MLFDISTGKPYTIPEWARQKLQNAFPDFYKGKSVRLKCLEERKRKVIRVAAGDTEGDIRRIQILPPEGNTRKAKGYVTDPVSGDVVHIQYSTQQPEVKLGGILKFKYPSNMVTIADNMVIPAGKEDLLFYVHFLCPHVKGNDCESVSPTPFYTYDKPEEDAKAKINEAKSKHDLEKFIYFDVTYPVIQKTFEAVGLKPQGSEERDRVYLLDRLTKGATETFKENVMNTIKSLQDKGNKSKVNYSELIAELLEKGVIKFDGGNWYMRDTKGDGTKYKTKPFFEGAGEESRFDLFKHLEENKILLDQLLNLK